MDNVEKLRELSEQLKFPDYNGFPDIELYMDQVLDFLSRSRTSLRDDDRLSSAMVNNYIKADILPRARGKKYSREHLVYLAVILRLKQVLSVKDTGALIKADKQDKSDEEFYERFRNMVEASAKDISEKALSSDDSLPEVAMRLAVESYLCKITCEYLIDIITDIDDDDFLKKPIKPSSSENKH
ncbi:MAG: DUF1836 domain-containing protein [Clostridiales bacterium]|mgnify:CR=1 FL=1|jgi:DNA-binding transcriptional MerR regulator|nr:DUF1836 domain-containing protein [Clostridiales bacterium]